MSDIYDFEKILDAEISYNIKTIINRCKEIVEEEIDKKIYDIYMPQQYLRTNQMRDNVRTDIKNGMLYIYINTGNMHYEDFYGNDVTKYVPYWLEYGHNSDNYNKFMLFQYPSRGFMRSAKERIKKELGLEVELISEGYYQEDF